MMTRTPAVPAKAVIWRVASMPSSTGIRTSMRTMSGLAARATFDRLRAIGRLARHPQPGRRGDDAAESRPDQGLVVGHRDGDGHGVPPGSGRVAITWNPPSGSGPAVKSPSHRCARSRMPARP